MKLRLKFLWVFLYLFSNCSIAATIPSSNIAVIQKTCTSVRIGWTRGDGQLCMVTCSKAWQKSAVPLDSIGYMGNTSFGSGANLDNENYCIFTGSDNWVTIYGLEEDSSYTIRVFELDYNPYRYLTSSFAQFSFKTHVLKFDQLKATMINDCQNRNLGEFVVKTNSDFPVQKVEWYFQDGLIISDSFRKKLPASGLNSINIRVLPQLGCKLNNASKNVFVYPGAVLQKAYPPTPNCTYTTNYFRTDIQFDAVPHTGYYRKWFFDNQTVSTQPEGENVDTDTQEHTVMMVLYTLLNNQLTGCTDTFFYSYKPNSSPLFEMGTDTCLKQGVEFLARAPIPDMSYKWNGVSGPDSLKVVDTGFLYLTIINSHGCSYTDSIHVSECEPNGLNQLARAEWIEVYTAYNKIHIRNIGPEKVDFYAYESNGSLIFKGIAPVGESSFHLDYKGLIVVKTGYGQKGKWLLTHFER